MDKIELTQYFPAAGKANKEIEITDVSMTDRLDVFIGIAVMPPSVVEKKVVIYQVSTEKSEHKTEYRAIPAKCPHQGADITKDPLKSDGNVYCSLHKRPICVFSEYNYAFAVEKRDDRFFIIKNN